MQSLEPIEAGKKGEGLWLLWCSRISKPCRSAFAESWSLTLIMMKTDTRKKYSEIWGLFHLQKISGISGGNFHRVKNVFHLTQVRSPPSDCDFTRQNSNSLEVVRPFKSCKWKSPMEKQDHLFRSSVYSRNFPVERTKIVCSIYIPTGISGISW